MIETDPIRAGRSPRSVVNVQLAVAIPVIGGSACATVATNAAFVRGALTAVAKASRVSRRSVSRRTLYAAQPITRTPQDSA